MYTNYDKTELRLTFHISIPDNIQEKMFIETGTVKLSTQIAMNYNDLTRQERKLLIDFMRRYHPHKLSSFLSSVATDFTFVLSFDWVGEELPMYLSDVFKFMSQSLG